jgi:rfaE bifunctional protein kinase chain/domain
MNPGVLAAFDRFSDLRVVVAGDIMLDAYVIGEVNRVSPEAPVAVLDVARRDSRPGGAANVAENVRALGGHVAVCALVGNDPAGAALKDLLHTRGVDTSAVLADSERPTTVKTRLMSAGQHLLRTDEESTQPVSRELALDLVAAFTELLDRHLPHVVILEDYDKGVLTAVTIPGMLAACAARSIPVAVDPKLRQFSIYRGVQLFKPNLKELKEGTGKHSITKNNSREIEAAIEVLLAALHPEIALVTLSELGVWVHAPHLGVLHERRPAHPREIVDVSGAGDTVIAVAALLLACGVGPVALAEAANLAGGLACERPGVHPLTLAELRAEWSALYPSAQ